MFNEPASGVQFCFPQKHRPHLNLVINEFWENRKTFTYIPNNHLLQRTYQWQTWYQFNQNWPQSIINEFWRYWKTFTHIPNNHFLWIHQLQTFFTFQKTFTYIHLQRKRSVTGNGYHLTTPGLIFSNSIFKRLNPYEGKHSLVRVCRNASTARRVAARNTAGAS